VFGGLQGLSESQRLFGEAKFDLLVGEKLRSIKSGASWLWQLCSEISKTFKKLKAQHNFI
jgi:hypothetical protein